MKKTNTKKALGMSLISLLACGTMFAGSTYAWFTDEVVASGNKIESGTLKADMEVLKDGQWVSLKENPETKIFDYDRWEPGYSASTSLRILNEGNLGFRYQVTGEFAGETFGPNGESLQDVIDVYMYAYDFTKPFEVPEIKNFAEVKAAAEANASNTRAEGWYKVGTLAEWMALPYGLTAGYMLPEDADYNGVKYGYNGVCDSGYTATVVLHMQEEAGNEYQGLTLGDVNLTLKATQWAWEKDGFGDSNYDKVEYISVDSSSNLNAVMAGVKGKAIVSVTGEVDAQNYTSINGLDVTFVGASEDATLNFGSADTYGNESNLKFENINLKFGNTNYRGFKHAKSESYVNCQIEGLRFFYSEDVSFEGCTFVQPKNNYNVWTYGATNVSFNDCDFYGSGKAILVYNESSAFSTNVEVEGCEFFSSAKGYTWDGQWVSAIEIDSSLSTGGHYTVTSTNNTISNNYSGALRVKKHSNNNYTITETGTVVKQDIVAGISGNQNLDSLLGETLTGDATVKLFDGANMVWSTGASHGSTPFGAEDINSVTIVGAGAENSSITFVGSGVGPVRANGTGVLTVKDVTVIDETVSYAENSWEFGYLEIGTENSEVVFENVVFESAIMIGGAKASFINCTFKSPVANEYAVWVDNGNVSFEGCTFVGNRGLKIHEAYGSEVASVVVNNCVFDNLLKKPGIAMGDLNTATKVAITNSQFINCQAGDQGLYIYETDTDVTTFDFTSTGNIVK